MDKKISRLRRARRARAKISELGAARLTVHRTPRHIYAQVVASNGSDVVASASTIDKTLRAELDGATGNIRLRLQLARQWRSGPRLPVSNLLHLTAPVLNIMAA